MGKFVRAFLMVCCKCGEPGGTLRKVGENQYAHNKCPVIMTKANVKPIAVPKSNLVLPTIEDVMKLRRPIR